jgi:hypothetical protein
MVWMKENMKKSVEKEKSQREGELRWATEGKL